MASSSCLPRTLRHHRVFTSFHGPDVRKNFITHLRKQFDYNGITMFDDQGIERGNTIAPSLTRAIRESRIWIVVLTKNYASSGWCLDELVEILKCKEDTGKIVMTIFYKVDPSDVRKQTGDFGRVFKETCARKTKEESERWSRALNVVGNIAGEHLLNWDKESEMIEKIARDVSNKLNVTNSRDFEDMVGLEAHLKKMQSLLLLDNEDEAMIVGICGPAGIGKTTIARALHSLHSRGFQLTCFMENLRGSYNSYLDEYSLKLCLQEQLLSRILNQNSMKVCHLGAIQEWLYDLKVLIVLDDVDDLKQLEALANETKWFGPGSRIIVTTKDQEILRQHGIDDTYHVGFPSGEEALMILCRYAFRKTCPHEGFKELAQSVTELCGNLPLGLRVVGSSLRGKKKEEWEEVIQRLEIVLDHQDIEKVLTVGYESLHENEKSLFLHIAVFFNYKDSDLVKAMFADNNLEIKQGLKILVNRSLIHISTKGEIVMHRLLQQVGRQAIHRQEPWKRQVFINAQEICHVLENDTDTRVVSGISFDTSGINEVIISDGALRRMRQLRFLCVYKSRSGENATVHIPVEMEFPPRLKLLHWEAYPRKSLSMTVYSENLVELCMQGSQLEKLWEGAQLLPNLKKMDLSYSVGLKELPDLSKAKNLETMELISCTSLVEIPSSIANLHKLEEIMMNGCIKLEVIPAHVNLASLERIQMARCLRLRSFPNISTNITSLTIIDTMLEESPESIMICSRLQILSIYGSVSPVPFSSKEMLERSGADIEKIPDCIKYLGGLKTLYIYGCPKLASLQELPSSLTALIVDTCESLETLLSFPFGSQIKGLCFLNCFKLDQEARRVISQQSLKACLPGRKIPTEFNHQTIGKSLTIRSDFYGFRICLVVSPKRQIKHGYFSILCRIRISGHPIDENIVDRLPYSNMGAEHLCIYHSKLLGEVGWLELGNVEILFEFSTTSEDIEIIECGVQILTDKTEGSGCKQEIYESCSEQVSEDDDENFSDRSYESCLKQVYEDEDESHSDGSYESCF